jgi:hypothetical protein
MGVIKLNKFIKYLGLGLGAVCATLPAHAKSSSWKNFNLLNFNPRPVDVTPVTQAVQSVRVRKEEALIQYFNTQVRSERPLSREERHALYDQIVRPYQGAEKRVWEEGIGAIAAQYGARFTTEPGRSVITRLEDVKKLKNRPKTDAGSGLATAPVPGRAPARSEDSDQVSPRPAALENDRPKSLEFGTEKRKGPKADPKQQLRDKILKGI